MPNVDTFIEETVRRLRQRLARAQRSTRQRIEYRLALLTDYRLAGMDEARFERLLAMLGTGRSPVSIEAQRPEVIAGELHRGWQAYRRREVAVSNAG